MDAVEFQKAISIVSGVIGVDTVKIDPDCFDKDNGYAYNVTDRAINLWLARLHQPYYKPYQTADTNAFWKVAAPDARATVALGIWKLHKPHLVAPIVAADMLSPDIVRDTRAASTLTAWYVRDRNLRAIYRPAEAMEDKIASHRNDNPLYRYYAGSWCVIRWEVESLMALRPPKEA